MEDQAGEPYCGPPKVNGEKNLDCVPRAHFDTFLWSFVTIFQMLSGENWNTVMYDGMRALGWPAVLYFLSVIIFGSCIILNLFLAILMTRFDHHQDTIQAGEDEMELKRKR